MWLFALAALIILATILVAARLARNQTIVVPREVGDGAGNAIGATIAENRCPACGDDRGFYTGFERQRIYCGNPECRAGFFVANFGEGKVWAQAVAERGPNHLYR